MNHSPGVTVQRICNGQTFKCIFNLLRSSIGLGSLLALGSTLINTNCVCGCATVLAFKSLAGSVTEVTLSLEGDEGWWHNCNLEPWDSVFRMYAFWKWATC